MSLAASLSPAPDDEYTSVSFNQIVSVFVRNLTLVEKDTDSTLLLSFKSRREVIADGTPKHLTEHVILLGNWNYSRPYGEVPGNQHCIQCCIIDCQNPNRIERIPASWGEPAEHQILEMLGRVRTGNNQPREILMVQDTRLPRKMEGRDGMPHCAPDIPGFPLTVMRVSGRLGNPAIS